MKFSCLEGIKIEKLFFSSYFFPYKSESFLFSTDEIWWKMFVVLKAIYFDYSSEKLKVLRLLITVSVFNFNHFVRKLWWKYFEITFFKFCCWKSFMNFKFSKFQAQFFLNLQNFEFLINQITFLRSLQIFM